MKNRRTIRKEALLKMGLRPKPRGLTLCGQNSLDYNECTRAEDRATQRCDPSAGSSAGMAGAVSAAPQHRTADSDVSLLRAKNGLDNRVHFRHRKMLRGLIPQRKQSSVFQSCSSGIARVLLQLRKVR